MIMEYKIIPKMNYIHRSLQVLHAEAHDHNPFRFGYLLWATFQKNDKTGFGSKPKSLLEAPNSPK